MERLQFDLLRNVACAFSRQGHTAPRLDENTTLRARRVLSYFSAITPYVYEWMVMVVFAILWLVLTFCLPVPGCPTGTGEGMVPGGNT